MERNNFIKFVSYTIIILLSKIHFSKRKIIYRIFSNSIIYVLIVKCESYNFSQYNEQSDIKVAYYDSIFCKMLYRRNITVMSSTMLPSLWVAWLIAQH